MNMWSQPAVHMICCSLCMITTFNAEDIGLEHTRAALLLNKMHSQIVPIKN